MLTNLKQMLEQSVLKYGEEPAFRIKTTANAYKEITYAQFANDVDALGTFLISEGLKDKHIAVLSDNRYEWLVSYFAVINGVGVVVPIDKDLPEEAILHLLKEGDVEGVLYSDNYCEIINKTLINKEYCFENDFARILSEGKEMLYSGNKTFLNAVIDDNQMAAILFTSGTTGLSKGVMLSHKNIVSNILGATEYEKYGKNEVMLSILPYHHAFEATMGISASLMFGACICINDSIKYFAKNMALFKPTAFYAVPAVVNAMYKSARKAEKKLGRFIGKYAVKKAFGGRLKRIFSGSAPLNPMLIGEFKRYGVRLCQGYGLTETSPVVSTADYTILNENNLDNAGRVIPNVSVKTVDGEIWAKGENVMLGYYKNPAATAEVFDSESGFFKTGDLGYLGENRLLYINGRKKNVIIASGGENVYPEELERYLYEIPEIADAVVYGVDSVNVAILPDYDNLKGKTDEEIAEIINGKIININEILPVYKQMVNIIIKNTPFEKTTTGKIKRNIA